MTKPTDDELGVLLRETFADKENLIESAAADQLEKTPERDRLLVATRRRTPIVLAAASVLAVLGGVAYVAGQGGPGQVAGPPTAGATQDAPRLGPTPGLGSTAGQQPPGVPAGAAAAWAAVILEIAEWERPAAGWPALRVLDAARGGAGSPTGSRAAGQPFTEAQRLEIERLVGVPVEWVKNRPTDPKVCDQPPAARPYVTVGPTTEVGAQLEIGANLWRGCLDALWLTYRLDQRDGTWQVTGTTGPQAVS